MTQQGPLRGWVTGNPETDRYAFGIRFGVASLVKRNQEGCGQDSIFRRRRPPGLKPPFIAKGSAALKGRASAVMHTFVSFPPPAGESRKQGFAGTSYRRLIIPVDHRRLISAATYPAPNPLSIFTTLTFDAHEFIIPSSAARPPNAAP